ncbi:Putative pterin-4-alpha-carbinolamine dehydratase [Rhodobacteraceae bacterium THAF1]|uniref:4a-hydroxytetrahydrobiopterin dehydratase n=1 Tax=Palleronia sp. THAF1 TaxID=2587842 RepID=UPI000F3DACB0|nr:4a-hydroxytetrahydrobiopterin dehydratase [Palleronia sp. THAF1]QFU10040.1 Putative pterin-4-alpha-carbinolamine dehydratase [Palleronia sp. THAF1]VDC17055.1 Putative pterin-4-alpha-carbinolamine dehydratase [Rhodobacteraceae bacterium THAF1]
MSDKLEGQARTEALARLAERGWSEVEGRDAITKDYKFADFIEAFGWMTRAAIHAQAVDHHPEWSNVYNRVSVTLTSHDVKGLSARDIDLAEKMDALT